VRARRALVVVAVALAIAVVLWLRRDAQESKDRDERHELGTGVADRPPWRAATFVRSKVRAIGRSTLRLGLSRRARGADRSGPCARQRIAGRRQRTMIELHFARFFEVPDLGKRGRSSGGGGNGRMGGLRPEGLR